jgi:lipoprotein-anchoring transpeptidase ErfK/SrfK
VNRPSRPGHAALYLAGFLSLVESISAGPDPLPEPPVKEVKRRIADPALPEGVRATVTLQIALEARGYSPGLIDGSLGGKTRTAIAAFQAATGLFPTGEADRATLDLLKADPAAVLAEITVTREDLAEVDPPPKDWIERSKRRRLLYPSISNLIAERVHTSERFLAALNPESDLAALRPGDAVVVPAVSSQRATPAVDRIEIDLERKVVLLFGSRPLGAGNARNPAAPAGILFCSIAADPAKAVPGDTSVATVAADPVYTFDPAKWPEVHGVEKRLRIPPGPRSPVGIRWIGLDREGVGIHGSPEPEMIGKTGSHGCFRLTNWDAVWLAGLVHAGMPVRIVKTAAESSWPWPGR